MARSLPEFHGFIGQRQVVRPLVRLLRGAKTLGAPLKPILFAGSSGLGKSQIVRSMQLELGTKLRVLNAHAKTSEIDLSEIAAQLSYNDILLVDEIHTLKPNLQVWIFRLLNPEGGRAPKVIVDSYSGHKRIDGEFEIPDFNFVGATDQPAKLLPAMKKRFAKTFEFLPYGKRELCEIIKQQARSKQMLLTTSACKQLIPSCRGIPRAAGHGLDLLKAYFGESTPIEFRTGQVKRFLTAMGLDGHGLTKIDRDFLKLLKVRGSAGTPLRLATAKLNIEAAQLTKDIEPFLFRSGFLTLDKFGNRQITTEGLRILTPTEKERSDAKT